MQLLHAAASPGRTIWANPGPQPMKLALQASMHSPLGMAFSVHLSFL